jgi:hypothetical protein
MSKLKTAQRKFNSQPDSYRVRILNPIAIGSQLILIYFSPTFLRHSPRRVVNSPNKYFTSDHKTLVLNQIL